MNKFKKLAATIKLTFLYLMLSSSVFAQLPTPTTSALTISNASGIVVNPQSITFPNPVTLDNSTNANTLYGLGGQSLTFGNNVQSPTSPQDVYLADKNGDYIWFINSSGNSGIITQDSDGDTTDLNNHNFMLGYGTTLQVNGTPGQSGLWELSDFYINGLSQDFMAFGNYHTSDFGIINGSGQTEMSSGYRYGQTTIITSGTMTGREQTVTIDASGGNILLYLPPTTNSMNYTTSEAFWQNWFAFPDANISNPIGNTNYVLKFDLQRVDQSANTVTLAFTNHQNIGTYGTNLLLQPAGTFGSSALLSQFWSNNVCSVDVELSGGNTISSPSITDTGLTSGGIVTNDTTGKLYTTTNVLAGNIQAGEGGANVSLMYPLAVHVGINENFDIQTPTEFSTAVKLRSANDLNNGFEDMEFTAGAFDFYGGNVGIGTGGFIPNFNLDVNGIVNVQSNLYVSNNIVVSNNETIGGSLTVTGPLTANNTTNLTAIRSVPINSFTYFTGSLGSSTNYYLGTVNIPTSAYASRAVTNALNTAAVAGTIYGMEGGFFTTTASATVTLFLTNITQGTGTPRNNYTSINGIVDTHTNVTLQLNAGDVYGMVCSNSTSLSSFDFNAVLFIH